MLLVTVGTLPAAAQTFDAALEAYKRGDYATALAGFQNYAAQGTATAQSNLGVMYAIGEGVPEDAAEAVRWFRLAAEQGYAPAQLNLGVMYAIGEGVPEDDVTAYAWLNIAAAQGQSSANEGKEQVAKHMTQSQVVKAQKLSREVLDALRHPFPIVPRTPKRRTQCPPRSSWHTSRPSDGPISCSPASIDGRERGPTSRPEAAQKATRLIGQRCRFSVFCILSCLPSPEVRARHA